MMEIMGGQIRGHYSVFRICRDSLSCIRTLRHGGCLPLDGGLNLAEGPLGWQCPTHVSPCCVCTVSHFIQESFLVEQLQKGSSASCSLLHLSVSSALQHSIVINHTRKIGVIISISASAVWLFTSCVNPSAVHCLEHWSILPSILLNTKYCWTLLIL